MRTLRLLHLFALALVAPGASAQGLEGTVQPEARVWLDRGDQPLLQRGERVRVYYRTSFDAYVAILRIDTDGAVRLLHPRAPGDDTFTRGERDYRLLFPQSSYWFVDEYPGQGYFFIVASPEPLDLSGFEYREHDRGWDLTAVGSTVYRDPYVAMDDYVARLVPDWEVVPYALDFVAYDVGETHDYPRFLCYDCHGYRSYAAWNPYTYACSSFRVVVWDDPYFHPAYRYRGVRVVYAEPRRGVARFEFKERGVAEAWTPVVRTRQPALRPGASYVEPDAARPLPSRMAVPRRPSSAAGDAAPSPARTPIGRNPTVGAPSGRAGGGSAVTPRRDPERGAPPAVGEGARPSDKRPSDPRPTLQRRPTGSEAPRPEARPRGSGSSGSDAGGTRVIRPPASTGRGSAAARPEAGRRPTGSPARPSGAAAPRPSGSQPRATVVRPPPRGDAKPPVRRRPGGELPG